MKAVSTALAMLVAGCGAAESPGGGGEGAAPGANGRIVCATGGAETFEPVCTVERSATSAGPVLTLRAPDGSFRRLLVTGDGRGVVAADGGEPARVVPLGEGIIEVAIGGDRYRLPATIRPGPA